MTCAACSARVEKAVRSVGDVENCSVNLLTGDLLVDGGKHDEIVRAVTEAGYGISDKQTNAKNGPSTFPLRRLCISAVLLLILMYVSMGHVMYSLPLPSFIADRPAVIGLCELVLSGAVLVLNRHFFINGIKAVLKRSPNMDTLVALGSGISFLYSTYLFVSVALAEVSGDAISARHLLHEMYFESAAMILVLITVGKMLESRAKGRTTAAVRALMDLSPKTAVIIKDGKEFTVPAEEIKVGDLFVVRPGGSVPADGVIVSGECAVDESALTGESLPSDKCMGDTIRASSVNLSGRIVCRAEKVGADTALAQIIKTVTDATATKAPIARLADRVSGVFVPAVLGISFITLTVWLAVGSTLTFAVERAISVLVISCPCALGLATPVAIMVGSGVGAKSGILFKNATALEISGRIKTVALDKTGTITKGSPSLTDIIPADGITKDELLTLAVSLEAGSEHPLAKAISAEGEKLGITQNEVTSFKIHSGNGLEGFCIESHLTGGKREFVERFAEIPDKLVVVSEKLSAEGKTPLFFARDSKLCGLIAVADTVKDDSAAAIGEMKRMGLRVVMITGDNTKTAAAIAEKVGINEVIAGVLPNEKADAIEKLKEHGKVAMIGDGINDSASLVTADLGIAIGTGVDIAIDCADALLTRSTLADAVSALKLGRAVLKNIRENLFWAFAYNVCCIPLAAGAFFAVLPWRMSPMLGAAAMSLSSFCVVTNALRLNFARIGTSDESKSEAVIIENTTEEEIKTMTKTVKIEGMMCMHCEAHVKKALEALDGVVAVTASHADKTAVIESSKEIADELIKATVEGEGYTYIG